MEEVSEKLVAAELMGRAVCPPCGGTGSGLGNSKCILCWGLGTVKPEQAIKYRNCLAALDKLLNPKKD